MEMEGLKHAITDITKQNVRAYQYERMTETLQLFRKALNDRLLSLADSSGNQNATVWELHQARLDEVTLIKSLLRKIELRV